MILPSVIYLERFGNPPDLMNNFIKSITKYPAGAGFNYVHVKKGFSKDSACGTIVEDVGYALNSLVKVLKDLTCEKFLFFTSYSKILSPMWLACYLDAFRRENTGIVGATGSYERNKHIRTNAFMMNSELFLELAGSGFETRDQECEFEAGNNNLTVQLQSRGLIPIVVNKLGKQWLMDDWEQSKTFRSGDQECLIVSDNRTDDYDISDDQRKEYLRKLSWGKV